LSSVAVVVATVVPTKGLMEVVALLARLHHRVAVVAVVVVINLVVLAAAAVVVLSMVLRRAELVQHHKDLRVDQQFHQEFLLEVAVGLEP